MNNKVNMIIESLEINVNKVNYVNIMAFKMFMNEMNIENYIIKWNITKLTP